MSDWAGAVVAIAAIAAIVIMAVAPYWLGRPRQPKPPAGHRKLNLFDRDEPDGPDDTQQLH